MSRMHAAVRDARQAGVGARTRAATRFPSMRQHCVLFIQGWLILHRPRVRLPTVRVHGIVRP